MTVNRSDFNMQLPNDENPDLSYLGTYGNRLEPGGIDRGGGRGGREYHYFNPGAQGNDIDTMRQNYARMESYNDGNWHCVGVRASVELEIPSGQGGYITQVISSPGVWGVESDSDKAYIAELFDEECNTLASMLDEMGLTVVDDRLHPAALHPQADTR